MLTAIIMKRLLLILTVFLSIHGAAQLPARIPPFKIALEDGQIFSATDMKKDRPFILIYFAPECDHCKTLMNEFFKKAEQFSKAEVVMITYKPLKEVKSFIKEYHIGQYPNIIVG